MNENSKNIGMPPGKRNTQGSETEPPHQQSGGSPPLQDNEKKRPTQNKNKKNDESAIKCLPLRTIQAGDKIYKGYYYETTLRVYLADEYGELTGQVAKITKPLPPLDHTTHPEPESEPKSEQRHRSYESFTEKKGIAADTAKHMLQEVGKKKSALINKRDEGKLDKNEKSSKEKKSSVKVILIALTIVAVGAVCLFVGMNFMSSRMLPFINNQTVTEPKEGEIMVIKLNGELIPGEEITESMISAYNIDSATYNSIAVNGNDLYRWEQRDSVIGMYATEYIASGKYITTNSVIRTYSFPNNPFGQIAEGMTSVEVPITIKDFDRTKLLVGSKINLHFQTDIHEDNTSETEETKAAGVKVTREKNITTTNSYNIENVVVANLRTSGGDSLYEKYSALAAIPEVNQESYLKSASKANKEYLSSIAPAKACIIIDAEYAEAIEKAINDGTVITMTMADGEDVSSEEKQMFYESEQKLMESFSKVL